MTPFLKSDRRGRRYLLTSLPALVVLSAWQFAVFIRPNLEFFLGSPSGIAREGWALLRTGDLLRDLKVTLWEAVLGFSFGSLFGTIAGLSFWGSRLVYQIARPYLIALGSVPVFALGPILIFWFGTEMKTKIVLGFLSTFVVATVQAYAGASEADPNLLHLTTAFGGGRAAQFSKIIAPSATIWVLAGIRLNIGMALLGAFVGEFLSSRVGIGHVIIVAEGLYNVNQIWVGIFCIILIAIFLHTCTMPIEGWARRWKQS
jgi:NitT/TauT family transport system permease protein